MPLWIFSRQTVLSSFQNGQPPSSTPTTPYEGSQTNVNPWKRISSSMPSFQCIKYEHLLSMMKGYLHQWSQPATTIAVNDARVGPVSKDEKIASCRLKDGGVARSWRPLGLRRTLSDSEAAYELRAASRTPRAARPVTLTLPSQHSPGPRPSGWLGHKRNAPPRLRGSITAGAAAIPAPAGQCN